MEILVLSWRGLKHPDAGGAEISAHEHAKGWVRAGHKVTLFTSSFNGARKEEWIDGVRVIRRGNQIIGVQVEAVKWYLFGQHPKFDLVIDHFHGIPFFTPLYVRKRKIVFIHEVAKEVWKLNSWSFPFNVFPSVFGPIVEQMILKFIYRKILFITVSDSTKKDLTEWGIPKENIFVIYNGVSLPGQKIEVKKEAKKTLIYLGALSQDKGIEEAIKAFSIIDKSDPSYQYWIVGKSDDLYLTLLKNKVARLGLEGKVTFWGCVSEKKKFELLKRAHLLINPSVREGWGLVVIEAAAMGTPTIAYNVPGLRDSVVDNKTGLLSKSNSTFDLAKLTLSVMKDKNLYGELSEGSRNWSKRFDWKKSVTESLKVIEK